MEAIVAVYSDWGIGDGRTQPVVLRADRKHFRELTEGAAVIVGRATLADFPGGRPLKGRHNIVITRQEMEIDGAQVVHSVEEALTAAKGYERCLVIGGDSVYRQFLPYMDTVHVTKIALKPESSAFFADLDCAEGWYCAEEYGAGEEEGVAYSFCTYKRVRP